MSRNVSAASGEDCLVRRRRSGRRRGLGWHSDRPVEPGAGSWRPFYTPDARGYEVPPPPGNETERTAQELAEIRRLTHTRSLSDVAEILKWSTQEHSPVSHWTVLADELCTAYGLTPPAGARLHRLMCGAVYDAMIACWRNKWAYLRPRPTDLDPQVDVSVIPVPQHPAYPSGHSAVAGAAATVLSLLFPDEHERCNALAEESGWARIKAGIHFRSDHTAGMDLGRQVALGIMREAARDGAPQQYRK